jgi:hypothetical protein
MFDVLDKIYFKVKANQLLKKQATGTLCLNVNMKTINIFIRIFNYKFYNLLT